MPSKKKSRRVFQRKETWLKLESWENYRKFASLRKHEVDREKMKPKRNMGLVFRVCKRPNSKQYSQNIGKKIVRHKYLTLTKPKIYHSPWDINEDNNWITHELRMLSYQGRRTQSFKEEIATFIVCSQRFCWERDTQAHCWRRHGSWFNREVFQDQGLLRANQRREDI